MAKGELPPSSWAFLMEHLLLQIADSDLHATLIRYQASSLFDPRLSKADKRCELLALLMSLEDCDHRPSGLLEAAMT